MKGFKKVLAFLLAAVMVMSLAACSKENKETQAPTDAPSQTEAPTDAETQAPEPAEDTYTYNYALSVFPTNWNFHTYETDTDAEILDYITRGFYTFDYNDAEDNYAVVPDMLAKEVEDVTADYVGKYGVAEGEVSKVWKLTLRDDLKWEDGTPITAQDFVTSAELLLNPIANNHRADSLYSGSMVAYNARLFLYQGKPDTQDFLGAGNDYFDPTDASVLTVGEDGAYVYDGKTLYIKLDEANTSWGGAVADIKDAFKAADGTDLYATVLEAAADENGMVKVTPEVLEALQYGIAVAHGYKSVEDYSAASTDPDYAYQEWEEFAMFYNGLYPEMDFSEVGVFAAADNELILALEKPLDGFYLKYSLTSSWLVNEELYKSCEKVTDGVYTNSYGTSAETTMSYGPYKLASFQADKEYVLERNENFYGLTDDTYQTTHIVVSYVAEPATRLELLLNGTLDSYGLSAEDVPTYGSSDYTYYTTGDSTYFVALNPDMEGLKAAQENLGAGYNKTILTIKQFRQALSFALDRSAFTLAVSPLNNPAFGVFSSTIISDPDNSVTYRSTDEAKKILADFWGLSEDIGEGKLYATVDDAVDSITGYNLEMAKQLFDEAYDIAIADGLMKEGDKVSIMIGTPNATSSFYSKGYDFLVNCYTDAVKGTKLEGKLEFTIDNTLGNGFANALRANQVDFLFGVGWTGSALDPYNLMTAYIWPNYQYDPSWNTTAAMVEVELDGVVYTASAYDWSNCINGEEITITAADGSTKTFKAGVTDHVNEQRFQILAALEGAILENYNLIPLMDDCSASIKGMQVEHYKEDYIYGVGRGGVKYMTYNYTDAEWADYVASQGGTLNYN